MGVSRPDNSVKIWRNLPISNPKRDLHNINAHTKYGENPLMFTRYHPETKNGRKDVRRKNRHTDVQRETILPRHYIVAGFKKGNFQIKNSDIFHISAQPISNPKRDLHNINAHTKYGENPLMFTRYHPETKNGRKDVRRKDRHTDVQRETIIPRHYIVAGIKKGNFQIKNSDIFHISAQTTGGSNEYPQSLLF